MTTLALARPTSPRPDRTALDAEVTSTSLRYLAAVVRRDADRAAECVRAALEHTAAGEGQARLREALEVLEGMGGRAEAMGKETT